MPQFRFADQTREEMSVKGVLIFLGLVALLILAILRGRSHWRRDTSLAIDQIKASAVRQRQTVDLTEIQDLPVPVKKYLHLALKHGAAMIHSASMSQAGGFRAKPEMNGWSDMAALQVFSTNPRAFVWDASISVTQGISIQVRDSYIGGKGAMRVKLISLLPLVDAESADELNEGALQRYLAEAVWFPTALLPSQGVTWSAMTSNKAWACINDSGSTASLEFEFNSAGEIVSVYSPGRYREISGKYEKTPWKGYFSDYREIDRYLIPTSARVEWHLHDRIYPYWQAKLHDISYLAE